MLRTGGPGDPWHPAFQVSMGTLFVTVSDGPLVLSDENASDLNRPQISLSCGGDFPGTLCGCDLSQWLVLSSLNA